MRFAERLIFTLKAVLRNGIPAAMLVGIALPGSLLGRRTDLVAALVAYWTFFYVRKRRQAELSSLAEWSETGETDWPAFWREFRRHVPSLHGRPEDWNPYREHERRRDLRVSHVDAAIAKYKSEGAVLVDAGSSEPVHGYTARVAFEPGSWVSRCVHADAERLPLHDASADVVVMSEAIEHLLRPDAVVWEVSRIMKPSGVLILTTNNAACIPSRTPLSHPLIWLDRILGTRYPGALSGRRWRWPTPVDPALAPPGVPKVYLPHTHHIPSETRALLEAAGLRTVSFTTYGFPPVGSMAQRWLESRPKTSARMERVCKRVPVVRGLGDHFLVVARKVRMPESTSPRGVWPGPLSE